MTALPRIFLGEDEWIVDIRLDEMRNATNPHDRREISDDYLSPSDINDLVGEWDKGLVESVPCVVGPAWSKRIVEASFSPGGYIYCKLEGGGEITLDEPQYSIQFLSQKKESANVSQ